MKEEYLDIAVLGHGRFPIACLLAIHNEVTDVDTIQDKTGIQKLNLIDTLDAKTVYSVADFVFISALKISIL